MTENQKKPGETYCFSNKDREIIYKLIRLRRDVRSFLPDAIPDEVLSRILQAAHMAPSVGYMQPWNFIIINDADVKRQIYENFERQNQIASQNYDKQRKRLYSSLKLQGILDAPINLVVTCDSSRGGPHVLGRNTMPQTDIFSVCCAIQNMWLAARAENIGVGWVSILEPEEVKRILSIPDSIQFIAYLCMGYPEEYETIPKLERVGWRERLELSEICMINAWNLKEGLGER